MPRALLSVSDKRGIVDLGRGLVARGFELVSTGGTARTLAAAGLPVTNVSDVTGFPEMLDGRVKTLHPKLHAGILARRDRPDDMKALDAQGVGLVDIVVVNLYPFAATAANPAATFDELVEEIDIGGPSMVRAAAKNFRHVLVVIDPDDYAHVLSALDTAPSLEFRFELMRKALAHTASYDTGITAALGAITLRGTRFERGQAELLPSDAQLMLQKIRDLRYGENPHQRAGWFSVVSGFSRTSPSASGFSQTNPVAAGFSRTDIIQGKELSYTNLLDLDAAARIVLEFDEPAAAVIKHTNPCGSAIGRSIAEAYVRARDADPMSAFGGIVGLNRPIDLAAAEAIASTRIDAVIAPAVDDAARAVLAKKTSMRVVVADFSNAARGVDVRSILGAMLLQERDVVSEASTPWTAGALPDGFSVPTKRQPTPEEWIALRFAWRICAHVKSNTIIFTDAHRTLAIGAGQMSRVDAANVAVMKARDAKVSLAGSVCASDAFFPFRDGLDVVAAAGAKAVIQPGGSVKDAEVIAAADEHGLAMVFAGRRHFRH
jgi:phosphoribosylaminoimidazolecarboxamide formyltransferase / IMP cyclohydrolase